MKKVFALALIGSWILSKLKPSEPHIIYTPPDVRVNISWEDGTFLDADIIVDGEHHTNFAGTYQELEQYIYETYGMEIEYF